MCYCVNTVSRLNKHSFGGRICVHATHVDAALPTVDPSVWASREHPEVRTWKQPYAVCQPASRTTHLNARSLMWSASANSTPWHQSVMRPEVPVVSSRQMTAWCPAQQHQAEPTTPTAALGTPVAPPQYPGPTYQTVSKS